MVHEMLPAYMRIRALALTAIVILSSITSVIASDTVTTQDVEISGNYTMTGNYTVSHGTTLTLKPGATIDMQDFWLKVDGNLVANNVTIMSSIQTTGAGSHNAGVWDHLTISSIGTATLDNVTISNAKSCIIADGTLIAKNLDLQDCLIGVEVDGVATIEGFSASQVDIDGFRVTGDADISDAQLTDMSGGVHSSGDLILDGVEFTDVGTGVSLTGGTADISGLEFISGIGNAVSISSGVSGDINGMIGSSTNAIVAIDSSGFTIANVAMSGERLLNSWSAGNLTVSNVEYESNSGETPIDIRTSGTVTLSYINLNGSFNSNQASFDAPWIGMSLAGSGDYIIESSTIESTDTALKASGTGTLSISESTFTSEKTGLSFSGISETTLNDVVVNVSASGEKGIDILQGSHTFTNLELNMPINVGPDSIGINAWWCDIDAGESTVNGFGTSIAVHESNLIANDLILFDSVKTGLHASSSMVTVNDVLATRLSDDGIILSSSSVVLRSWGSSYHSANNAQIDSNSELTVWSLSVAGVNQAFIGDGIMNYGTTQTLAISTAQANRIWEVAVNFEDLTGNPVDADWTVLGFSGTASGGSATLPVSEAESTIIATYAGVGSQSTPSGSEGGAHVMQVPIMPQSDWTLAAGSTVVLGPTADGSPHMAGGNITIPTNTQLFLQDTTLQLPPDSTLTIMDYGGFEASNGNFKGDIISHTTGFSNAPSSSMTVDGDVFWTTCQNDIESYMIQVLGDIQLDSSCKVKINRGKVLGNVAVFTGATFEIVNTLEITVLDKGEAVQGASVEIDGQSVSTGADGKASKSLTSLMVDSNGETVTGLKQVRMEWGSIVDLMAWDTSSSMEHTFTASTIAGGSLTEWLVLEKAWSPYHLSDNLVIPQGQTMTINDGVALRIADSVSITVEGTFNSGVSTIYSMGNGARWSGLIIGDNADSSASILGTTLVEGSPLITIQGQADVVVSNALLSRSTGAEPLVRMTNTASGSLQLVSTTLTDSSSHCIEAQGSAQLILNQVVMQSCASNSLWARSLPLSANGLDVSQRIDLEGVTGEISDLTGHQLYFNNLDGFTMDDISLTFLNGYDNRDITIDGATIATNTLDDVMGMPEQFKGHEIAIKGDVLYDSINNSNSTFILHDGSTELKIDFSFASTADGIEDNRTLYAEGVLVIDDGQWVFEAYAIKPKTSPVDLDNTAGSISNLIVNCGGQGTGLISHHGRTSPLIIEDSSISSCTKGVDLHSDSETAPLELINVDIDSLVAISSDGYEFTIHGGELNGSLETNSIVAKIYDVEPTSISGSGEIWMFSTHIFDVRLNGDSQNANIEVTPALGNTLEFEGSSIQAPVIYRAYIAGADLLMNSMQVIANAEGLPTFNQTYSSGPGAEEIIQINMSSNEAPTAEIIIPDDGFSIMESLPIEVRAVTSDDLDDSDDLEVVWTVTSGQTELMQLSGHWANFTDLGFGTYVLKLEVTDSQGATTIDMIEINVIALDSDGDWFNDGEWINSCNEDTWFDKENNVHCGPNFYDSNDDNDEINDNQDKFPLDPCASLDTDGDGQPDDLHCPIGVTTWLTADQDDDNDGIPDVSEKSESAEDSDSNDSPIVIMLFVGLFIAAAAIMLMRNKTEVE